MSTDSYLGGSDAQQIYPANTVDLIIVSDPNKKDYRLTQDVPGGYEGNVLVVRGGLVLQPEAEYTIDYSNTELMNNIITFQVDLFVDDQIFVIHKGAATYNMAPSPKSVTDESLSDNLRGFIYETFNGGDDEYQLLKQEWHPRSLLVYVSGVVQRPFMEFVDGVIQTMPPNDGTWDFALVKIDDDTCKIVFTGNTPAGTKNVAVLHLAFSTVLRRSNYIPTIALSPNSIETQHLQDNSVTGVKILLENDEYLRSKNSSGVSTGVIKLNASDQIDIYSKLVIDGTKIEPILSNTIELGSSTSKKFKKLWITDVAASGAITSGTVTAADVSATDDLSAGNDLTVGNNATITNQAQVNGLSKLLGDVQIGQSSSRVDCTIYGDAVAILANDFTINGANIETIPIGVILPYAGNLSTPNDKWLFCDGALISPDPKYIPFKVWLGDQGLSTTNTPDLKQKFLFGKDNSLPIGSGKNVGDNVGAKTHYHNVNNHNHSLSSTNVTITDSGHEHDVSGKVYVPSHTHYLNVHDHAGPTHSHKFDYLHFHKIHNIDTSEDKTNHTHTANFKRLAPVLGGSRTHSLLCKRETGLESASISENEQKHAHSIDDKTTFSGPTPLENYFYGNYPGLLDWSTQQSETNRPRTEPVSGGDTGNPKNSVEFFDDVGYTFSWNRTRYNKWDETNPNNMNAQSSKELSIADGAADSSTANCSISGSTENKTGLTTTSNSDFAVPGFTLNFIIRAVA